MTKLRAAIVVAAVALAGFDTPARGAAGWQSDQDAKGFKLFGLPLVPDRSTGAATLRFVTPGAGYLKASAQDGTITAGATIPYADITGAPAAITATTGDVVSTGPGSVPATIQANVVSNAKFRQGAATSLVGNPTGSTANVQDIAASGGGQFIGTNAAGTALSFTSSIPLTSMYTTSVANVAALEALAGSGYRDGSRVYVQTVASDFVLHTASSATVDHITIASVSGMGSARWIRAPTPDGFWYGQAPFYVGGAGASDENNCTAAITPCATSAEVRRRLLGRNLALGASNNITINLQGDLGDTDFLQIDMTPNVTGTVVSIIGTPTVTALGTVSAATAKNYAAGTAADITITGFNWAPWVNKIIRRTGTTGTTSQTAIVTHDLGSGKARITQTNVGQSATTDLTTGDVLEGLTLPRVPGALMRFPGNMIVYLVNVDPTTATARLGDMIGSLFLISSTVQGTTGAAWIDTGTNIVTRGVSFSNRAFSVTGNWNADRCLFLNSPPLIAGGRVGRNEWQDDIFVGNTTLSLGEGTHMRFHSIGVYDQPAAGVAVKFFSHAYATFTDYIYGTGNNATSKMFTMIDNSHVELSAGSASILADMTIAATLTSAGVDIAKSTLPYYPDQYGNEIIGAQNVDVPAHLAVVGSDLTGFFPYTSVTGLLETGGPTHMTYGAIPVNSYLTRGAGTTITGATTIPYSVITGAPSAITALTGDGAAAGPGSAPLTLATVGGGTGSCTYCSVTFDAKGRQTAYSSGTAPVTSVSGTAARISSTGGATPVLDLVATAVTPASYTYGSFTVDAYGRLTAASSGAAPVTSVSGTAGHISSSGGATPTIDLVSTAVTPGNYTYAGFTVDATGRLTAASSGATPALASRTLTGTTPILVNGDNTAHDFSANLTASLSTPPGRRVLASDVAGTGFVVSDEIRLSNTTDEFMVSKDGALTCRNLPGISMVGAANYEQVRASWQSNVWTLASEKAGTGTTVRPMKIDAGTAVLTLAGSSVIMPSLAAGGTVVADPGTGILSTLPNGGTATKHDYFMHVSVGTGLFSGEWAATSSAVFIGTGLAIEYPNDFIAGHVAEKFYLIAQTGISGAITCSITLNGAILSGTSFTFTIGTTANGMYTNSAVATGSASVDDVYGLYCIGTAPTVGGLVDFSEQVVLTP